MMMIMAIMNPPDKTLEDELEDSVVYDDDEAEADNDDDDDYDDGADNNDELT